MQTSVTVVMNNCILKLRIVSAIKLFLAQKCFSLKLTQPL